MHAQQEQRFIPFKLSEGESKAHPKQWEFLAEKIVDKNPKKFKELTYRIKDRELIKRFVARIDKQRSKRANPGAEESSGLKPSMVVNIGSVSMPKLHHMIESKPHSSEHTHRKTRSKEQL